MAVSKAEAGVGATLEVYLGNKIKPWTNPRTPICQVLQRWKALLRVSIQGNCIGYMGKVVE